MGLEQSAIQQEQCEWKIETDKYYTDYQKRQLNEIAGLKTFYDQEFAKASKYITKLVSEYQAQSKRNRRLEEKITDNQIKYDDKVAQMQSEYKIGIDSLIDKHKQEICAIDIKNKVVVEMLKQKYNEKLKKISESYNQWNDKVVSEITAGEFMCPSCSHRKIGIFLLPCSHTICEECSVGIDKCPKCSCKITESDKKKML